MGETRTSPHPARLRLTGAAGLVLAVAAALYAFGRIHTPDYASTLFGRRGSDANLLKAQLATVLLGMALFQLILAVWIYGRLPGARAAPRPVHLAHRIGGVVLFLVSLPIAYHCITAYGVETTGARVTIHSVAGCFFYGAFVAKIVVVRSRHLPGWALPLAGGSLVTLIAILWYSAALWQLTLP